MKFYGIGKKKTKGLDGVNAWTSVLFPLTETTRVGAVNQANRIAKRDRIQLEGVYLERGSQKQGGILTKNMKTQKANRAKANKPKSKSTLR